MKKSKTTIAESGIIAIQRLQNLTKWESELLLSFYSGDAEERKNVRSRNEYA